MPLPSPTSRLLFRPWQATDFPLAVQLWGDGEVTKLFDSRCPLPEEAVRERFERELRHGAELGVQYWPILLRENGEFIGCCGLKPHPKLPPDSWEMGFHLRPPYWGKGLATEAGRSVVDFAFGPLGAEAIYAGHHPENIGSGGVLLKLGFKHLRNVFFAPTGMMHPWYCLAKEGVKAAEMEAY